MSKFAYTTYQNTFINEMKLLDDMMIDQCPLITKFEKKYHKVFIGLRSFFIPNPLRLIILL